MSRRNDTLVETIELDHGVKVHIHRDDHDTDFANPRENDNLGVMVCFHRRYNLGDKHDFKEPEDFVRSLARMCKEDALREVVNLMLTGPDRNCDRNEYRSRMKGYKRNERRSLWADFVVDQLSGGMTSEEHNAIFKAAQESGVTILPLNLYDHSGISMSTSRDYPYNDMWDAGQVGWIYAGPDEIAKVGAPPDKVAKQLVGEVEEYDLYLTGEVYGFIIETPDKENVDSCWGFLGLDYIREDARSNAQYYVKQYGDPNRMAAAGI